MPKIAVASDLHLNNNSYGKLLDDGLPLKIHDNFAAFDFVISKCLDLQVNRLVITGDVYENPSPTSKIRTMFNVRLQKLIDKDIEVVILTGNHDSCKEHHALEPLKGWNRKLKIKDSTSVEKINDVNFIYIPHTNAIESRTITFKEYVSRLQTKIKSSTERNILFGHFGVFGAFRNDYARSNGEEDVSREDLENLPIEACFLGHFHKRQKLSKDKNIWYVGSTERRDFSEKDQVKGFCIYDLDTKSIEWIDYQARKMIEIVGKNYEEISSNIESCKDLRDSIVNIKVIGSDDDYADIQKKFLDLSSTLKSKDIAFFSGLDRKKIESSSDDYPEIKIEFKEGVDVFKVVEQELLRISELESKEEIQQRLSLLKDIQDKINLSSRLSTSPTLTGKRTIRFKWIKYHNFCRFGEENNVLDLDKLFSNCSGELSGIASIVGVVDDNENEANGAGKSTILEGIAYALYEKMPRLSSVKNRDRKTTTEIVRTNDQGEFACRESFVELCLEVDGSDWVIKRGRKVNKIGNHSAILNITKDGKPFNSIKMKEPNQVILDLVGMDFEPFCNSVFFAQKDTNKIFTLTPKGKIDTVLNVLGILRDVDEAIDIVREKKKEAKEKCLELEGEISVVQPSALRDESVIESGIQSAKNDISILEKQSENLEKNISELEDKKVLIASDKEKSLSEKKQFENLLNQNSLKKKSERESFVSEQAKIFDEINREKLKDEEFEKNKANIKSEYDKENSIISKINLSELKKKLEEIEKAKIDVIAVKEKKKTLVSKRTSLYEEKGNLLGEEKSLSESLDKYNIVILEAGNSDSVCCPYCKSVKNRKDILAEIEVLKSKINAVVNNINVKNDEIRNLVKEIDGVLSIEEEKLQNLINSEGRVAIEMSKHEMATKNLERIVERAKSIKEAYRISKGRSLDELQKLYDQILESIKSVDDKYKKEDENIILDIRKLEDKIRPLDCEVKKVVDQISNHKKSISENSLKIKNLSSNCGSMISLLESLKQAKIGYSIARKELENQRLIQTRVAILEGLFGSDGIRIKIADIYIPIFNRHLTDFVTILTAGRMHIQLEKGTLDPKITGGSSANYEMLSGGEQDVIRLAANLALGMVSLGSSRSLPETLFLDEVFGSLAPAMQDRVFDLLRHLRSYFSRILVITHNPVLQERFDKVVCVEKIGGISQISIGEKS